MAENVENTVGGGESSGTRDWANFFLFSYDRSIIQPDCWEVAR